MATVENGDGTRHAVSGEDLHKATDTSKWYMSEIKIPASARKVLEEYAGIAPDKIDQHVEDLRKRAFVQFPYPCIGMGSFLSTATQSHPMYPDLLARIKAGATFLDAGCCFGQDLRRLLLDGAPSSAALYGTDVVPEYFALGKELFCDADRIQSTFFAADLTKPFDSLSPETRAVKGKIDIIGIQNVFHLFNIADSKTMAKNLITLAKPQAGSVIFGRQVGSSLGHEVDGLMPGAKIFAHNEATWRQHWDEVAAETNTKWNVEWKSIEIGETTKKQPWYKPEGIAFAWSATRLE